MHAIRIHHFSDEMDNLLLEEVDKPVPAHGEVLVRMRYAPVHPADFNYIRGDYHSAISRLVWNRGENPPAFDPDRTNVHPQPPYTLGVEGVGVVEASGGGFLANRLKGKRVALSAGPPQGTWQQYTVVDAKRAVAVADSMEDTQAALYLANPLSCYAMVVDILGAQRGGWLLQSGAGSALGQMVIRLGKRMGFKTINLVRSANNVEKLLSLGADVVVNTSAQDIQEAVYDATGGRGATYAMDCIGGDVLTRMMQCLSVNGYLVVYGTLSGLSNTFYSRDAMMPCARVSGYYAPNWLAQKSLGQKLGIMRTLKKLHEEGIFKTEVGQVFDMGDATEAVKAAGAPGHQGKALLRLND